MARKPAACSRHKEIAANRAFTGAPRANRKASIRKRDGHRCKACGGTKKLEVHHIESYAGGGSDHKSNLVTLCQSCHRAIQTGNPEHAVTVCVANAIQQGKEGACVPLNSLPKSRKPAAPPDLVPIDYDLRKRTWRWGKRPKGYFDEPRRPRRPRRPRPPKKPNPPEPWNPYGHSHWGPKAEAMRRQYGPKVFLDPNVEVPKWPRQSRKKRKKKEVSP